MIVIDRSICTDFECASSREWLETNGIGGYASSTLSGAHSRRYHGLLIAATRPPLGRMLLLSKFEETLIIDGERFELSCNRYPGTVYPDGYKFVTGFRLDPFPVWSLKVRDVELERSVFMVHGENTTVCQWKLKGGTETGDIQLELKPLLAFRDHHHLRHIDNGFNGKFISRRASVSIKPYDHMPELYLRHNATSILPQGHWYRDLEYSIEQERGFDHREDLFQPFDLTFDLVDSAYVVATTDAVGSFDVQAAEEREIGRRQNLIEGNDGTDDLLDQLTLAADQFIVARGDGDTVIAGYPWFSDWGRDTMIALNGLTLATGRPQIARNILYEFSHHLSQGMLPNRFPDEGEQPEYNTVDATLWYFEAIRAYLAATDDLTFVRDGLYDKLVDVVEWHVLGTRYGIHVDTDGLLFAGETGVQLTWMDAKIGDWVVTPRIGKAVEIQALWYNALCVMSDLADQFGDTHGQKLYTSMAAEARSSFNGQFWNETECCFYDVINGEEKDGLVRPNQIFAVSLPYTMGSDERARQVVDKVRNELLTPFGLRSLSPREPRFVGTYIGSPFDRDASYHQGTVWGWLIGGFIDAYRKVYGKGPETDALISELVAGSRTHIREGAVGQIAEIFDGDPPHLPRGCGAQAWSVAELLRVIRNYKE